MTDDDGVFVVTGGGSGIGAAVCEELAKTGARIAVLDRDMEKAEMVAGETGGTAYELDVTDEQAVERTYRGLGPIRAAVNCAGFSLLQPIVATPLSEWRRMTSVHLDGTFLCLREAAASMIEHGIPGSIVNIASVNAQFAHRGLAAYSAAKAGVVMLSRVAALELATAGIRVNCVAPGMVVTGMNSWRMQDESFVSTWSGAVPLDRVAAPVDIAKVVTFLTSPDSGWVTGQTIVADGGVSLRVEPKVTGDERWMPETMLAARQADDAERR
ncbi:SDR family NAD(P)-dependent oxidoreductase [Nocardia alni]|uniref:SDR family NAD(P)-dependent oxidoreductase n=1 Tax=Nocardia alni TaxID=2815723 RepID=UPI001C2457BD|nr:SDR family oxidoreductase [Nocardia alni]